MNNYVKIITLIIHHVQGDVEKKVLRVIDQEDNHYLCTDFFKHENSIQYVLDKEDEYIPVKKEISIECWGSDEKLVEYFSVKMMMKLEDFSSHDKELIFLKSKLQKIEQHMLKIFDIIS